MTSPNKVLEELEHYSMVIVGDSLRYGVVNNHTDIVELEFQVFLDAFQALETLNSAYADHLRSKAFTPKEVITGGNN